MSTHGAVGVNYFKMDKERLRIYIGNVIFLVSSITLSIACLLWIIKTPLSIMISFPESWLMGLVFIAFAGFIIMLTLSLWQVEQKSLFYGLFQNSQVMLNLVLTLYFVVILKWQWEGRLWGILIPHLVFGAIGWTILLKRQYVKFIFKKEDIRDALAFGIPLFPHALGGLFLSATDRIFLNSMVGLTATGLYTVGYQIGAIVELLGRSFNSAFAPFLFSELQKNSTTRKLKIVKLTYLCFAGIILITLLVVYLAPFILKFLVTSNFAGAEPYIKWIALAGCANWMYYLVANYIFFVKKTHLLAITTFFAAVFNIILNYILIKKNGPVGAAQATAIACVLTFILTYSMSVCVYRMPWNLKIEKDETLRTY